MSNNGCGNSSDNNETIPSTNISTKSVEKNDSNGISNGCNNGSSNTLELPASSSSSSSNNDNGSSNNKSSISSKNRICRRFVRGLCRRKHCRYPHVLSPDLVIFCHDFQNASCPRENCEFLHYTLEEEEYYRKYGKFPQDFLDDVEEPCKETLMCGTCCHRKCFRIRNEPMWAGLRSSSMSKGVLKKFWDDNPNILFKPRDMCESIKVKEHKSKKSSNKSKPTTIAIFFSISDGSQSTSVEQINESDNLIDDGSHLPSEGSSSRKLEDSLSPLDFDHNSNPNCENSMVAANRKSEADSSIYCSKPMNDNTRLGPIEELNDSNFNSNLMNIIDIPMQPPSPLLFYDSICTPEEFEA